MCCFQFSKLCKHVRFNPLNELCESLDLPAALHCVVWHTYIAVLGCTQLPVPYSVLWFQLIACPTLLWHIFSLSFYFSFQKDSLLPSTWHSQLQQHKMLPKQKSNIQLYEYLPVFSFFSWTPFKGSQILSAEHWSETILLLHNSWKAVLGSAGAGHSSFETYENV